jgi:hypothetical protein
MSLYLPGLPTAVRFKALIVVIGCFVVHTIEGLAVRTRLFNHLQIASWIFERTSRKAL